MDFLSKMYEEHKTLTIILGLLLLPITLAIVGIKLYMTFNANAAAKSIENAQKKDDTLAAQEDALKKQADASVAEADKAAQRIEDRHAEGAADLDWETKRKD